MTNVKQAVPFFMVTSMGRSLDFYVGRLGSTIKDQWQPKGRIEWCLLLPVTVVLKGNEVFNNRVEYSKEFMIQNFSNFDRAQVFINKIDISVID